MDPSITGAAYSMGPLSQFAVTYRDLAPLHDEPFMIYPHFVLNTIYRQPIKKKSIQIKKKNLPRVCYNNIILVIKVSIS